MAVLPHLPSRREALIGSGALFAWTQLPKLARAEGRDPRMLVIVLRGALDGLGAVAPVGDPDWIGLRGDRALVLDGKTPALPLDSFFALNPAMPNLHRLYKAQQATIVHATATPYRERSHFDGQDVLESGLAKPGAVDTGWLNRALLALASGGRVDPRGGRAMAVGPVTPLVVRGQAPVMSWAAATDAAGQRRHAGAACWISTITPTRSWPARSKVASAWRRSARAGGMDSVPPNVAQLPPPGIARVRAYFAEAAGTAARYLARPDGPRVGAMGFVGWDTHINEGAASGQLANLLGALDGALAAIETNMGDSLARDGGCRHHRVRTHRPHQRHRRHRPRHRHGGAAGRRRAPGRTRHRRLAGTEVADLYEGRDLKATIDLRAVLKGLLRTTCGSRRRRWEAPCSPAAPM